MHYLFADLAVLILAYTSYQLEIHHLSLKEGFCGVCIEKGARSFRGI